MYIAVYLQFMEHHQDSIQKITKEVGNLIKPYSSTKKVRKKSKIT